MTLRSLCLGILAGVCTQAFGLGLDDYRYRNRANFDDRLDEIEYCNDRLARAPRGRDQAVVRSAMDRADAYMERWADAGDRVAFAAETGDEAIALAGHLMQLSLDLRLDDHLADALDEAQLDVCAVLAQKGYVARDAELRALESALVKFLERLEKLERPPNGDEITELTFDVALLTQQAQLARRARRSGYEIDTRLFDLLTNVLGRKTELN